jgi:dihydroorotate dehydrogenase
MNLYDAILRPALFKIDAEKAHDLAKATLRSEWLWRAMSADANESRLQVNLGGMTLSNPICLSAGFDKNAEALLGLQHLGFGAITIGSILPTARPGNPKPRLIRYPAESSLGNCYGLPSDGVDACAKRLKAVRAAALRVPVIANIDAPSIDLYVRSFEIIEPLVNAVELGLQCPNNPEDHGELHDPAVFEALLTEIMKRRRKPIFLKLAFPASDKEMLNRCNLAERAVKFGVDGINVPGIFKRAEPGVSLGVATVSGKAAFARTLSIVRELAHATKGRIAIKANGGIMTGEDALAVLMAGATTIDVLSAFVFRGWSVAAGINNELLASMQRERISSLASLKQSSSCFANEKAAAPASDLAQA